MERDTRHDHEIEREDGRGGGSRAAGALDALAPFGKAGAGERPMKHRNRDVGIVTSAPDLLASATP